MPKTSPIPGERAFIEFLRAQVPDHSILIHGRRSFPGLALGIGDDCAILRPPRGHEILVTTDFSLETIHFRRDRHSPESVGHRCLTRGLSDLAAMGAQPLAAFLSLALPPELIRSRKGQRSWRDRFLLGLLAQAKKYRVPLAGGDTAQSPRIAMKSSDNTATGLALADIVLVGSTPRGQSLRRSTAQRGDCIYVTGYLGGAAAELAQLTPTPRRFRRFTASEAAGKVAADVNPHPHLFPEPRLAVGAWLLRNHRASAAIDISDGLSTDLDHLCEESKLAATIDVSAIPFHPLAQKKSQSISESTLALALNGGEDYELLFTASPTARIPRRIAGVPIMQIGTMRQYNPRKPRVLLIEKVNGRKQERPLPAGGWEHYK